MNVEGGVTRAAADQILRGVAASHAGNVPTLLLVAASYAAFKGRAVRVVAVGQAPLEASRGGEKQNDDEDDDEQGDEGHSDLSGWSDEMALKGGDDDHGDDCHRAGYHAF